MKGAKIQNPALRKNDRTWAKTNKKMADLFAKYIEETFQPHPRETAEENIKLIRKSDVR